MDVRRRRPAASGLAPHRCPACGVRVDGAAVTWTSELTEACTCFADDSDVTHYE